MKRCKTTRILDLERCEDRTLLALIFLLDGNAYDVANPSILTANAAQVLQATGNRAIQLSTPNMAPAAALQGIARQITSLSHGQPIGLVGFSAGGTLALRLATIPTLHVTAALDYYGPPDLRDFLRLHHGDRFYNKVVGSVHFTRAALAQLSGPGDTSASVVAAFGLADRNVVATASADSFKRDFPGGHLYFYPGGHGVSIQASPPALEDFLAHLGGAPG